MRRFMSIAVLFALIIALALPAAAADEGFTLGRFVTCKKVGDREPVGITDNFPKDTVKVYAFIEALDVEKETDIKIQWLFEGKETAMIELTLGKSKRWRTFSSKRIGVRRGNWEVRMLDIHDNLIKSLEFTVK